MYLHDYTAELNKSFRTLQIELVRLGHDVTLFASGEFVTRGKLVSCAPLALRLRGSIRDPIPYYMLMLDRVRDLAEEFDILHFHIDHFHFPVLPGWRTAQSRLFMVGRISPI